MIHITNAVIIPTVSISFRENLLSDSTRDSLSCNIVCTWFPSLSERTFFRTSSHSRSPCKSDSRVSISFRENLLSDIQPQQKSLQKRQSRFHLFQREPSFGPTPDNVAIAVLREKFPSLSERAFFRTPVTRVGAHPGCRWFPSLSERAFFRTGVY